MRTQGAGGGRLMVVLGLVVCMGGLSIGSSPPLSPAVHASDYRAVGDTSMSDTGSQLLNPHSDVIFRVTGAKSCRECHRTEKNGNLSPQVMDNDMVRGLIAKAKGVHGPGRFADCFRCHAGGHKGMEQYQ